MAMRSPALILLFGLCIVFRANAEKLRLAVGPYFAPAANHSLQTAGELVPELLTVELSHGNSFEIIEREKIRTVLQELHLTADNVNTSATLLKLGELLGCDRLVTGTIFTNGTNVQVWTKLIDTRTSVVVDLEAVAYQSDVSATVKAIANFLSHAGHRSKIRQFITLGRLADLSVSSGREDWTPRFRTAIERHFLEAGYGVVEREVMKPIIEEYQIEGAGLTGSYSNRIHLQPAVWMLDGGWRWIRNDKDRINVVLRLQKAGGPEQMVRVTALPDDALEQKVLAGIEAILKKDEEKTAAQSVAAGEAAMQHSRAMELAMRNGPMTPSRFSTNPDADEKAKSRENLRAMLEGFEKTLMLDPNNWNAKRMLARGLLADEDVMQRQRATNLLQELVAAGPPAVAAWAKECLGISVASQNLQNSQRDAAIRLSSGNARELAQSQPGISNVPAVATFKRSPSAPQTNLVSTNASKEEPAKFSAKWVAAIPFQDVTAMSVARGAWLIATGTQLHRVVPDTNSGFLRFEVEAIDFSPKPNNEITAIAENDFFWWLGTLGGGLVRVDKTTRATRVYSEQEGLLMTSIATLALIDDQLWVGFGFRESGGLGCLDLKTDKFRGFSSESRLFEAGKKQTATPAEVPINAIKTSDEKTIWVGSSQAVHSFDVGKQMWKSFPSAGPPMTAAGFGPYQRNEQGMRSQQLPRYGCVSVNSDFVAVGRPLGGVSVCKTSSDQWTAIDLAQDRAANTVNAIRVDCCDKRLLWVGGRGKLSLVNMSEGKVVGACDLIGLNEVMWIQSMEKFLVILVSQKTSGFSRFYCMYKPVVGVAN